jgi:CHAT domain-containing protein
MSQRLHTAIVDLTSSDTVSYQYMCREGVDAPPLATFEKHFRREHVLDCALGLIRTLQQQHNTSAADLQHWGGRLYDELIPHELSYAFRSDTRSSNLVMYLDPASSWIPWELLWDGDEFLCRRFRLARLLLKCGSELRAANDRLRGERSGRGSLIVFGDISGLNASNEKAVVEKNLNTIYGDNVWFHTARNAADILEELKKDYELCHFIGHGEFQAECPAKTGWRFADGSVLSCRDIEAVSSRATFPLLIFANSCNSARPGLADAQAYVTSLYRAFLRQGVPHYIGTILPVPDEAAKDFAQSFYTLLARGLSVGEALGETRRAFAEKTRLGIWGCYVHYGDPTFRLLVPQEKHVPGYEADQPTSRRGSLGHKTSFSVLGKAPNDEIHRTLEHYKVAAAKNPGDGESQYAVGLCYLQLGLHELAIKNFTRALELMPDYPDAYYYYGLSLIRGRRPKLLSLPEVKRIEEYLTTALQLDARPAKYYYFAAILKYDYYLSNGLLCDPSPDELFLMAEDKDQDAWEIERLLHAVPVRDPDLISKVRRNHETLKI